ncbi:MAG: helix-hairpin-helix domain-containing protein [Bacteroidales bacterium]|jgi:hypothetical protein|nr:helix-hairpin-helix domain-containing protein [Bacteroidales bacterium]NLM93531.1 helix-hairpin-helix domain-containing protein [Bacteroidales bacterium]
MIALLKKPVRLPWQFYWMVYCFLAPLWIKGQTPETPDTLIPRVLNEDLLQQRIESLAEEAGEDTDFSALIQDMEIMLQFPLNLNEASAKDLHRLIFLNELQIQNLLEHIGQHGKLLSITELQSVDGFDLKTIQAIQPYITVSDIPFSRHLSLNEMLNQGQHQLFLRWQRQLEKPRGYLSPAPTKEEPDPQPKYPGSPYRLYSRYRFTCYNHLSIGFTAEKDPGEQFMAGGQPYGFDYYSGHALVRDLGRLRAAVVGDYQLQFGQGLTLWSGLTFGKSSEALSVHKYGQGIRPHSSVDENAFFRGMAACLSYGALEITGFASSRRRDANILDTDTLESETLVITSFQQTGLHRTPAELADKNAVRENLFGGHLAWKKKKINIGLTASYLSLNATYRRDLTFYNQFDFNQSYNSNLGLDYSFIRKNAHFFGETAMSGNGGFAMLNGFILSLDPRLSFSMLHRYFSRDYQALYAAAFSENTRVVNEHGLYMGIHARFSGRWQVSAYADHYAFPWMKYRTYSPTHGFEYLAQVNYRPRKNTELYLRYRIRNKPLNTHEAAGLIYPDDVIRHNLRFNISHAVTPVFTLRNRVEYTHYHQGQLQEEGFVLYQDVLFRNPESPWAITLRYALFDTGGYDSRIYVYENDVLYAYSIPFLYHRGSRAYALIRYRFNRHFDLYGRLARTFYANPAPATTGPDGLDDNTRTEIKLQVRARF